MKRLTDALKNETFTPEMFPYFMEAFKVLVEINFNGENARSLSLFVTYALHDTRAAYAKRPLRPRPSLLRIRKGPSPSITPGSTPRSISPGLETTTTPTVPLTDVGIAILGMLTDLLCTPSKYHEIVRFAKFVTGKVRNPIPSKCSVLTDYKWLLYLFAEPDQRVVVMGAKILARLLVVNGPHYVKKFAEKSGGFVIMKQRLKNWWNTPGLWTICFAIMFDRDIATIDFERTFDVYNLVDIFISDAPKGQLRIVYPDVFPVIVAMLDAGLRAIVKDQPRPGTAPATKENEQISVTRGRRRTMSLNAKQPTLGKPVNHTTDYRSLTCNRNLSI